jgi:hypothetical protein
MQSLMQKHLGGAVLIVGVAIFSSFSHRRHILFEGFKVCADSRSYRERIFDIILLLGDTEEIDGGEYSHDAIQSQSSGPSYPTPVPHR